MDKPFGHHSTFGRSGQIAPHGSLFLWACLRAQFAVISAVNANSFSCGMLDVVSPDSQLAVWCGVDDKLRGGSMPSRARVRSL
jgi:hypothetical protein